MKTLTKLEEFAQLLFSIYLFSGLPFAWWIFPLFFFAPDLSMIGLLLVWQVFGPLFQPVFSFALRALYPGQGFGS